MNPKDVSGQAKPNLSIVPLRPLYEAALALYEGARKYGPENWRDEKVNETIYVDAAIRHLNQWIAGEDIDPDSGLPHISKAIAGLIILRDAQHHGCSIDTRRSKQNVDFADLKQRIIAINEKYPDPVDLVNKIGESACCHAGGVPLTEEQAEKAAEAYGITDLINNARGEDCVKYSVTKAAGGSYEIKAGDDGKAVVRRDGVVGLVFNFVEDTDSIDEILADDLPVYVIWDGGVGYYYGVNGAYNESFSDYDVVKVIHA